MKQHHKRLTWRAPWIRLLLGKLGFPKIVCPIWGQEELQPFGAYAGELLCMETPFQGLGFRFMGLRSRAYKCSPGYSHTWHSCVVAFLLSCRLRAQVSRFEGSGMRGGSKPWPLLFPIDSPQTKPQYPQSERLVLHSEQQEGLGLRKLLVFSV